MQMNSFRILWIFASGTPLCQLTRQMLHHDKSSFVANAPELVMSCQSHSVCRFRLLNMRADMRFILLRNGLDDPTLAAMSDVIRVRRSAHLRGPAQDPMVLLIIPPARGFVR